jgi:DNA-directed RNA polymerase subunit F
MVTAAHNLYGKKSDSPFRRYARAIILIAVVLGLCIWGVRALSDRFRDLTPDELRAQMEDASKESEEKALEALPLDRAIAQVNRMTPEQRREVMRSDPARNYLLRLKPEHRRRFVRETLDRGIQEQLERFHKMNKEERKEFVEEIRKRQQDAREKMDQLPPEKKEEVRKMASSEGVSEALEQASKAFLSLTTSDERAELQPLYEGALDNLKHAQELK